MATAQQIKTLITSHFSGDPERFVTAATDPTEVWRWLGRRVAFDLGHDLLDSLECNLNLVAQLGMLPSSERVRKTKREYLAHSQKITAAWSTVRQRCTQAERFSTDVLAVAR